MKKEMKRAVKSYYFWISASAFVLLVLKTLGVPIVDADYNELVTAFLGLLVMLGVLQRDNIHEKKDNSQDPPGSDEGT